MKIILSILVLILSWFNVALAEEKPNAKTAIASASNFIERVLTNENTPKDQVDFFSNQIGVSIAEFNKKKTKFKSESAFLEHVFYKVHKKYLKKYEAYQSFNKLMSNGIYGCLTGTALYAIILDKLGFGYEIVETNYHIYLMVTMSEGKVMIESTDAFNGFVSNSEEIAIRIKASLEEQSPKKNEFQYALNIFNQINLTELVGLQHYNLAVNAYNVQNIEESLYQLNEATKYYPSPRIIELLGVINSALNNTIDKYLENYQDLNSLVIN